jgi:hypothetical protein
MALSSREIGADHLCGSVYRNNRPELQTKRLLIGWRIAPSLAGGLP